MNKNLFEINAGLGFNPFNPQFQPQVNLSTDLSNLSAKWIIVIGLGLVAFGIYRHYQAKKEKV